MYLPPHAFVPLRSDPDTCAWCIWPVDGAYHKVRDITEPAAWSSAGPFLLPGHEIREVPVHG